MKLIVLTAIIAAVASSPLVGEQKWPWQVGKVYTYDVETYTLSKFEQSLSNGNAFKAQFVVSVQAAGHLIAELKNPSYAPVKANLASCKDVPADLSYQPLKDLDCKPFEIFVEGGRVVSINLPSSLSIAYENLLKGLISSLQVDFSPNGIVDSYPNSYDKESYQGLFKKMEADVTGNCETLYSVSPVPAEWRRELPEFISEQDPIEIIKSKDYKTCEKRVAYHFGVPEGAVWQGIAYDNEEQQFIKHSSESRLLVSKQGTIYKSEVVSSVFVSPLIEGKQKAEVSSYTKFYLKSVEVNNKVNWEVSAEKRSLNSLLYTADPSARFFTFGGDHNVAKAQQILQEITPLLQNPNNLPKGEFLTKFNVLVYVLASMNSEQLAQLSSSVEIARTSKNAAKAGMWIIYRDAVAQAGTLQAFEEIKSWVVNNKVQEEEAAEVITAIGVTISEPSKKLLEEFFKFATCSEVIGQKFANNSALLAVSKLYRYADEEQIQNAISHFSNELKYAIEKGDSSKAQVYIRVLSNLAHPSILKVYAPYLEGKVPVSKYLRIQMVTNLKPLANLRNEYVRAVLYSIIRNTAEDYEIRVAAVLNIFLAFPTFDMMQVLAHMTTEDPSTQVRAAIANSIIFSAGLKDPRFAELATTAKSVLSSIEKEKFGYRYSTNSMMDDYTGEDEFSYFRELSFIGSKDNILPKYQRSGLRYKDTGLTEDNQVTLSVSDMQDLLNYFIELIYQRPEVTTNFKFSAKKVIELLNIKRAEREPLEAALFIENLNQQKLYTFSEDELNAFFANTIKNIDKIFSGLEAHYTKILSLKRVFVAFPLSNGMPFIFEYSEPALFMAQTNTAIKFDKENFYKSGTLENKIDVTYARNLDGFVGFMDTLGDVFATSGVVNKFQVSIPIKINAVFSTGDFKIQLEPLYPEKDANILHLSVWPYNGIQKKDSLTYDVEYLKRPTKTVSYDFKVGSWSGMAYQLQGYSYSSDYEDVEKLLGEDMLTNIGNLLYQKDIAQTQYNFKFLAKESKVKTVSISLFLDTLYNQKNGGKLGEATLIKNIEPNSEARRKELAKQASSGIESAEVQLVDLSIGFNGQKVDYVFTGAFAYSFVDPKLQASLFARGSEQITAVLKLDTQDAKIVPLNLEEALKNKIKITYEADIKADETNVKIQGYAERSEKYTELLKNDPLAKKCLQDVSQNNFYQKGCYKMLIKAHSLDFFKATLTYKDVDATYGNLTTDAFKLVKESFSWEEDFDMLEATEDGKVEFEAQAFYYDANINYKFVTKYGALSVEKVAMEPYYPYYVSIYGPLGPWERSRNWFTGYQNIPYCAVDDNKVWTFSGRSYNYSLSGSWHAVMVDEANNINKWSDLVVLARRPSENEEEVYVSYVSDIGKFVEIQIKPNHVDVKSNTEKICDGSLTIYWDKDIEVPLLEYYKLAEGVQVFNIREGTIRIVYDHQRLIIFTGEHRTSTRGICGQSSSDVRDDYLTPWGLVDSPYLYGASFSLEGECSEPKTAELKKEAKEKAYQPVIKYTHIPLPDLHKYQRSYKSL